MESITLLRNVCFSLVIILPYLPTPSSHTLSGSLISGKTYAYHERNLSLTYLGLDYVYDIQRYYTFFVPNISVTCECACTNGYDLYCSPQTHIYHKTCTNTQKEGSICSTYESFGQDGRICPNYYRMCCQTFFRKNKMVKHFQVFPMQHKTSIFKLNMNLPKLNTTLFIQNHMKYILLSPDVVLNVLSTNPNHVLPNGWFCKEEDSNDIIFLDKIDNINHQKLNQIGSFQISYGETNLDGGSLMNLKQHFNVQPVDCRSNPPKYSWALNAKYFLGNGLLRIPEEEVSVNEKYNHSISHISVQLKNEILHAQARSPPVFKFSLSNSSRFLFKFQSIISISSLKHVNLFLNFTKGKGKGNFFVDIRGSNWQKTTFHKILHFPYILRKPIPYDKLHLYGVCVRQQYKYQQLCQIPTIIGRENLPLQSSTLETTSLSTIETTLSEKTSLPLSTIEATLSEKTSLPGTALPETITFSNNYSKSERSILTTESPKQPLIQEQKASSNNIIIGCFLTILILAIAIAVILYFRRQKRKSVKCHRLTNIEDTQDNELFSTNEVTD